MGIGGDDAEMTEVVLGHETGADIAAELVHIVRPADIVAVGVGLVDTGGGDEDILVDGEVDMKIAGGIVVGEAMGGLSLDEGFFADGADFDGATFGDAEDFGSDKDEVAVANVKGVDDIGDVVAGRADEASLDRDKFEFHRSIIAYFGLVVRGMVDLVEGGGNEVGVL